ncbi:MAG: sulfatase-like hydrolase/transferase, partial [Phycisphaerae bacterium]|nr:sulfatase-like hydrolase/transferase [Phycisphaerae bacterium]
MSKITRREFLKTTGLAAASAGTLFVSASCALSGQSRASTRMPNIVFIFIDDLGYKDLTCFGSTYYETPNIDKLASDGIVFTSAYANAPNCAPTRACLISGQYTPRHGVYTVGTPERGKAHLRKLIPIPNRTNLDSKVVTVPQALKAAGYKTACIGKWHLGDKEPFRPEDRGFDVVFLRNRQGHFTADGRYLTDVLTDESLKFIEQNRD